MNVFETIMTCLLVMTAYVLVYIAGRCDFLNVVCLMMQEYTNKMEEALKDDPDA